MKTKIIALAMLASIVAAPASATNLVVNGGFETGDFTGWTQYGDLSATQVTPSTYYTSSGNYGVAAGPRFGYGHLDQTITTLPNHYYQINFQFGSPLHILFTPDSYFSVHFNSQLLFLRIDQPEITGFASASLLGVSTGLSTVLGFTFADEHFFFALDDVSVTDLGAINPPPPPVGGVPEPATWALLIIGFGMVGAGSRRRRAGQVAA